MGDFYPWGPHGPRSDHPNVIPNPTAPDPAPKFEAFQPYLPSVENSSPSYSGSSSSPSPALSRGNPGKSVLMGILLTALFGPLGLFYASKKGALVMLAAWFGLSMLLSLPGAAQPGASSPALWIEVAFQVLWPLAALGSIIWSVIAIIAHNKKRA